MPIFNKIEKNCDKFYFFLRPVEGDEYLAMVVISNTVLKIKPYLVKFPIHFNGLSNQLMTVLPKYAR